MGIISLLDEIHNPQGRIDVQHTIVDEWTDVYSFKHVGPHLTAITDLWFGDNVDGIMTPHNPDFTIGEIQHIRQLTYRYITYNYPRLMYTYVLCDGSLVSECIYLQCVTVLLLEKMYHYFLHWCHKHNMLDCQKGYQPTWTDIKIVKLAYSLIRSPTRFS